MEKLFKKLSIQPEPLRPAIHPEDEKYGLVPVTEDPTPLPDPVGELPRQLKKKADNETVLLLFLCSLQRRFFKKTGIPAPFWMTGPVEDYIINLSSYC